MGLACTVDVIFDLGLMDATPTLGLPVDYSDALSAVVDDFFTISSQLCPVRTGYLLSTLEAEVISEYECEFQTLCDYAEYVEYGTIYMDAQPYFTPAIMYAVQQHMQDFYDIQQDAMNEEAEILQAQAQAEAEAEDSGGGGGFSFSLGGILALFVVALVVTAINNFFSLINGQDSSPSRMGSLRGDTSFVPMVEII